MQTLRISRWQNIEYFAISDFTFIVSIASVGRVLCFVFVKFIVHARVQLKFNSVYKDHQYKQFRNFYTVPTVNNTKTFNLR